MFARMFRGCFVAAAAVLALGLSGCSMGVRADASKDIAAFLKAAHQGDRKGFEAGLDRPALRSDLRDQIADLGRNNTLDVDGGPSEFAIDRMISPRAFRLVEAQTGRALPEAPTPAQVQLLMTVTDRSHVCIRNPAREPCVLRFAKAKGQWRLVGMPATDLKIEVQPARK
jgi:hypothetical protein